MLRHTMALFRRFGPNGRTPIRGTLLAGATCLGLAAATVPTLLPAALPGAAKAQGTSGLVEFRWDNNKDYNKLYFFLTNTLRQQRSDYYLLLRPKDRKTAILKLTITVPEIGRAHV